MKSSQHHHQQFVPSTTLMIVVFQRQSPPPPPHSHPPPCRNITQHKTVLVTAFPATAITSLTGILPSEAEPLCCRPSVCLSVRLHLLSCVKLVLVSCSSSSRERRQLQHTSTFVYLAIFQRMRSCLTSLEEPEGAAGFLRAAER